MLIGGTTEYKGRKKEDESHASHKADQTDFHDKIDLG
jgi:hypothetical protein